MKTLNRQYMDILDILDKIQERFALKASLLTWKTKTEYMKHWAATQQSLFQYPIRFPVSLQGSHKPQNPSNCKT